MRELVNGNGFSLSVVIPAFNETHRLPDTLRLVRLYLAEHFLDHEVIVVDDGSTDGTDRVVLGLAREWPQLILLKQPSNMGKGAAVRRGVLHATKEIVLFSDADLATPIEELGPMLANFKDGVERAVVGVRTYQSDESKWRRVVGLSLQVLTHLIVFERAVVDSQCGFKCFGNETAHRIFSRTRIDGGMFDVEIFAIMQRLGIDVRYQAVHWANKAGSRINILRCILFDPIDMIIIRTNMILRRYDRVSKVAPAAGRGQGKQAW